MVKERGERTMLRSVLFVGDKFLHIDFENKTDYELIHDGFTRGVGVLIADSTKFSADKHIDNFKKICDTCNSNLAVVFKNEFDDKIALDFYHQYTA